MAGEFSLVYDGSNTPYVQIRRTTDSKIWDFVNSAWETYDVANWANYDLDLTNKSGNFYSGDFPTAVAAQTSFKAIYYSRSNGAASTDLVIGSDAVSVWTGATVTSPPAQSAITAGDAIEDARRQLRDDHTGSQRWSNTVLLRYLSDAIFDLGFHRRPDLRLTTSSTLNTVASVTATTDQLIYDRAWQQPLADFICYRALNEDHTDLENVKVAQMHYQSYLERVAA
jgi:hypothetical protein